MFHICWLDLLQSKQKLMLAAFIDGKLKTIFIAFVRILWKRHLRALAGPQWDIRVSADEKHWDFGGDAGWVLCRFYKTGGGGHRGEVGVNSICLWFVIPTLEWIISLVSSHTSLFVSFSVALDKNKHLQTMMYFTSIRGQRLLFIRCRFHLKIRMGEFPTEAM